MPRKGRGSKWNRAAGQAGGGAAARPSAGEKPAEPR